MNKKRCVLGVMAGMVLIVLTIACGGEERSAETPEPAPGMVSGHAPTAAAGATSSTIPREPKWDAPPGWIPEAPSSTMRKAQYRIPATAGDTDDGECAVFYFGPGQGGDVPSNILRWTRQFTSPEGTLAQAQVTQVKSGDFEVTRVEIQGSYTASPMSMSPGSTPGEKLDYLLLGAIIPGGDANWFIKCTGPRQTMEANREPFDAMIASIR